MDEQEFRQFSQQGFNRVPVVLETLADLDTPLSVYLKLGNLPYSYLLESVQGGERFGRYSFIGLPAEMRFEVRGRVCSEYRGNTLLAQSEQPDPLDWVRTVHARFNAPPIPNMPRFAGGLVGYFGYDTVRYIEPRLAKTTKPDALGTPDIMLLLSDRLAVVDNLSGKLYLVVYADPREEGAYAAARALLEVLFSALRQPVAMPAEIPVPPAPAVSEFAESDFIAAVARAKRYIFDGDIMQVVLSQRLSHPYPASPLSLYRALRVMNPSPYLFYFDMGGFHIVGASPEILVRRERTPEGDKITIRPLAGTRPRGATPELDRQLEAELSADPKERAEHLMLIDLARNDIGRIAKTGSVKVTDAFVIERYSHVMHIVSNVEGLLKDGMSNLDVLRATFPAGTLTGAPKVRAMQIIDELEPVKRGIYGGACGYLSFAGDMDVAIAIRTGIVKDGMLYVQAAAGVVADSVPEMEWRETEHKARALIRAAELVEEGF